MKRFLNILSIFASAILSIIFVITTFSIVLYYSVAGLLHPKTITTVIQNVDYVEILKESKDLNQAFIDLGLDEETKDAVIKSDSFDELWDDVAVEFTNFLTDSNTDPNTLDTSALKDIVNNHTDDILAVVQENSDKPIEKNELSEKIDDVFENKSDVIEKTASKLEPIKQMVVTYETATKTVYNTFKWYYILGFCLTEVFFLVLIYILRRKNYSGFIWISVNSGIAGLLLSAAAVVIGSSLVTKIMSSLPSFAGIFVDSAIQHILTKLILSLIICFAIMIASIVACVLFKRKKAFTA